MASKDTGKRFFNLGTRHITIGVVFVALLSTTGLILHSIKSSTLSRIEDKTLSPTSPLCSTISTESSIDDVTQCFPGFFLTDVEHQEIAKIRKQINIYSTGHDMEATWLVSACCNMTTHVIKPTTMTDVHKVKRTMATFLHKKQYFFIAKCQITQGCDYNCLCKRHQGIVSGVYITKNNKLKAGLFLIDNCCVCPNT